ncbi:LysR family transcriptional regulator [Cytobacillus horneckiae]|uniref:LysR family transcriptional regulator n=1 Tax=Cytobacillus horneckiae TaxID=549687 RepID=UPI003D9A1A49
MNTGHLEYIVEVAKTSSLSLAAQNLNVTQSGISQAITNIEAELGFKIFKRLRGHGAVPTDEGKQIINLAYEVLMKLQELKEKSRHYTMMGTGKLKLATTAGFMRFMLQTLSIYKKIYPNVDVEIAENESKDIIENIIHHKIDIGLISIESDLLKDREDIVFNVLLEGKMKVYVSKNSPLAFVDAVTSKDLLNETLVIYDTHYMRQFIHNFFDNHDDLHTLFTSKNIEIINEAVIQGLAISFAPDFTRKNNPFVLNGDMVPIDLITDEPISVSVGWIKSKKHQSSKHIKEFSKLVNTEFTKSY